MTINNEKDSYKDREYVSTTEIAAYLRVSRVTVFKWIKNCELETLFVAGSHMISIRSLEKYLQREVDVEELTKNRKWME